MMTKKKNGWTDKRSTFILKAHSDGAEDRLKIEGDYYVDNIQFGYSITEQKKGDYTMRGEVVPRSPNDGHRMRLQGKERRETLKRLAEKGITGEAAEKHESMVIRRNIYLREKSEKAIKEAITHAAEMLFDEIGDVLNMEAKKIPGGQLTAPLLVRLYNQKYFNKVGKHQKAESTYQRNKRTLKTIGSKLGNRPASQISLEEVTALAKELDGDVNAKMRLAMQFWDYCLEVGVLQGDNPFKRFLNQYDVVRKKKVSAIQQKALRPSTLPQKVEETLNQMIADADATDAKMTGLLIIKEIDGLSARQACDFTWDDFLFDPDDLGRVRVSLKNEDIAGATHDFTKPCFRFFARELRRRYDVLKQKGVNRKHILLKQDGKRLSPKELIAFCRESLLIAGMSYSDLQPNQKETGGIGVHLFNRNIHYRITNICGLGRDKGASKYSAMESMAGYTTSDHYRSLSCEEGQDFLRIIMNRDGRFEVAPQLDRELCACHPDGTHTVSFLSDNYDRLTAGMVQYVLMPGEQLTVSADGGITGSMVASKVRKCSNYGLEPVETEGPEYPYTLNETEALEDSPSPEEPETSEESKVSSNNIESTVVKDIINDHIQLSLFD